MSEATLAKRRAVMRRSMTLGHCICDVRQPCPCETFRKQDLCHCAGERAGHGAEAGRAVRLTEHVRNAGCASKIPKAVLAEVLHGLPELADPRVVVGASCGDDAGVIMLSPDTATIFTVDVFAPAVDDPFTFGRIAAANSLSDIYAMGGKPQAALSIIGFPVTDLPLEAMREILRGGADTMKEADVPIIGGHSINDVEVKCGFAVIGTCPGGRFVRNAGAQVGDRIVLTKPLGTGIALFARQVGRAAEDPAVTASMASLNRVAGELMVRYGVHAATDVTGFSLLGHMAEIARHSGSSEAGVVAEIDFDALPLFAGVAELAAHDVLPGAVERNRESVPAAMLDLKALTPGEQGILFGAETSGGILAFMPQDRAEAFVAALHGRGVAAARIVGQVTGECPGGKIRAIRKGAPAPAGPVQEKPMEQPQSQVADAGACCAAHGTGEVAAAGSLPAPAGTEAFRAYMAAVQAPGALGAKHKKLISLALSVATKCEPCVKLNAKAAREAGASEAELSEAVALGIAFGGASCAMFYNTVRGM